MGACEFRLIDELHDVLTVNQVTWSVDLLNVLFFTQKGNKTMPIYEYRCNQCGKVSEILIGVGSDENSPSCQHCGSHDLEKILSVSSFTFGDGSRASGMTCCGRDERCDSPPCSTGGGCWKEQ